MPGCQDKMKVGLSKGGVNIARCTLGVVVMAGECDAIEFYAEGW